MAIEKIIRIRDQRRALPAQGDIRGTKISNRRDPRARRDNRRLANLHCRGDLVAKEKRRPSLMENRLAVRTDQINSRWRNAQAFARTQSRVREEFSQSKVKLTDFVGRDEVSLGHVQDF